MNTTTNVEFIATYIYNNPGARHIDIMRALRAWRGIPETYPNIRWCNDMLEYVECVSNNTWGRQYFNRYATSSNRYLDTHWKSIEEGNPRSGYMLTLLGMSKVKSTITTHRNDLKEG